MAPAQPAPGLWRTDLREHDLSVPGRKMIQNRVELRPEAPAVRHRHPGEKIIYVLEGSKVQSVRNVGTDNAAELATYFVESDKPFLVVVD